MELTISRSSFRVPPIISRRFSQSFTHANTLIPTKPITKDIKCSTNKLTHPIGLYGERRFSISLLLGQNRLNSIKACAQHQFGSSDPVFGKTQPKSVGTNSAFAKVVHFASACYTFTRPYAMVQVIISVISLFARVMLENGQLFKGYLLFKAFPGLVAMILAHAYFNGINQIFDADIDRLNKPYLPIPAGDISVKQAWFLMIFFVLAGLLILWLMKADLITTGLYCSGLLFATLYSAPPFRFKGSSIATTISIASSSIINAIGVLYATMDSLGLPFRLSPPLAFMLIFDLLFFAVISIVKDIPDVEGDMKHNIQTFAARYGPKTITFLGTGILLVNYVGGIAASLYMPQAFKRIIMLPAHSIFALWLIFQVRKLDKANYCKEASGKFYGFMWKLLIFEFLLLPFM